MKRFFVLLVILIVVMTPAGVAGASDITDAEYYGTIRVSNNGTAATNVATPITGINTTNLIDGSYLNATANNCAIQRSGSDVAFMPGWGTNPWMLYEPAIGANTYLNDIFYTSATDGTLAYFPDSNGMDITDSASMEISYNGSASLNAFIDTDNGSNKIIFQKSYVAECFVSPTVSGNITANATGIFTSASGWTLSDNATDDDVITYASNAIGAGSWSDNLTLTINQTALDFVRFYVNGDPAKITQVQIDIYNGNWNNIFSGAPVMPGWNTIELAASFNDVTLIVLRMWNNDGGATTGYVNEVDYLFSLSATGVSSGEYDIDFGVFTSGNETQSAVSGLRYFSSAWGVAHGQRFNDFQETIITQLDVFLDRDGAATGTLYARVRDVSSNSIMGTLGQIDVSTIPLTGDNYSFNSTAIYIPYTQDIRVTLEYPGESPPGTFISTYYQNTDVYPFGLRTTSLDLTTWSESAEELQFVLHYGNGALLAIDDVIRDYEIGNFHISDTSDNFTFGGDATLYITAANITVDGSLAGRWQWEYGATFTDLSGNGNHATPSFRTTSSNANVSATLVDFQPITEADAPAYTITSPTDWVSTNTTVTENFTTTITPTYPGSGILSETATAGQTPVQLPTLIIASVFMLGLSLTSTHFLKKYNTMSLLAQLFIIAAGLGILVAVHVIDNWMLWLFLMIGMAIAMMSTRIGFAGTGTTGNNLVGFLFMSFAGMTLINRILEGRFLQTADINIINDVLVFQPFSVFGWFTIPVPNVSFLTNGIPAIVRWDYSFFGGDAQIIQYMLYSITAVLSFILFVLALGAAYQMFSRGR